MTQSARNRIYVRGYADLAMFQTIAVDYVLPFNATLIQFLAGYRDVFNPIAPNPADTVSFGKVSGVDARLNIDPIRLLRTGFYAWENVICNEHFEFAKGDHLIITASNQNNLAIGVEAVLAEAG